MSARGRGRPAVEKRNSLMARWLLRRMRQHSPCLNARFSHAAVTATVFGTEFATKKDEVYREQNSERSRSVIPVRCLAQRRASQEPSHALAHALAMPYGIDPRCSISPHPLHPRRPSEFRIVRGMYGKHAKATMVGASNRGRFLRSESNLTVEGTKYTFPN
jgi:hypothetical protein